MVLPITIAVWPATRPVSFKNAAGRLYCAREISIADGLIIEVDRRFRRLGLCPLVEFDLRWFVLFRSKSPPPVVSALAGLASVRYRAVSCCTNWWCLVGRRCPHLCCAIHCRVLFGNQIARNSEFSEISDASSSAFLVARRRVRRPLPSRTLTHPPYSSIEPIDCSRWAAGLLD